MARRTQGTTPRLRLRTCWRSSTRLCRRSLMIRRQAVSWFGRDQMPAAKSPYSSGQFAWVLGLADRLIDLGAHRTDVDLERHTGCAKVHRQVLVVAEGLVLGKPAPAQRRARQRLDGPVLATHLDFAGDQQRSVADRGDLRAPVLLRRAPFEAAVLERSARAPLDDLRHGAGVSLVGYDPGPPLELEHPVVAAKALA